MPRQCGPKKWVAFERKALDFISWGSQGLSDTATAAVELENSGTWWDLVIDPVSGELTGYFAGPDQPSPGSAHVIPVTSHATVKITESGVERYLDGGFIHLIP
jgi:hypothetical protein